MGPIDKVFVASRAGRMQAGCLENGIMSICDVATGRVNRDMVFISEHENEPMQITSMKMNESRLIAGRSDGIITVVNSFKEGGSFANYRQYGRIHSLPITCLETIQARDGSDQIIISASLDGFIRMTHFKSGVVIRSFRAQNPIKSFSVDKNNDLIVGLTCKTGNNSIVLWKCTFDNTTEGDSVGSAETVDPFMQINYCGQDAVEKFFYDHLSSLIFIPVFNEVHVYSCLSGKAVAILGRGSSIGHTSRITCLSWDADIILAETKRGDIEEHRLCLLVTGDSDGNVALWNCRKVLEEFSNTTRTSEISSLSPVRVFRGHCGKVTCVDVDAFKISSAGQDGLVQIWDVITGQLLRKMNARYFSHHRETIALDTDRSGPLGADQNFDEKKSIRCLSSTLHQVVIGIKGGQVKAWDLDPDRNLSRYKLFASKKKKQRLRSGRSNSNQNLNSRSQLRFNARQELKEANRVLKRERQERDRRVQDFLPSGMSEEEAVRQSLALSMIDSPKNSTRYIPGADYDESRLATSPSPRTRSAITAALRDQNMAFIDGSRNESGSALSSVPFSENFMTNDRPPLVPLDDLSYPPLSSSPNGADGDQNRSSVSGTGSSHTPIPILGTKHHLSGSDEDHIGRIRASSYQESSSLGVKSPSSSTRKPRKMSLSEFMGSSPTNADLNSSRSSLPPPFPINSSTGATVGSPPARESYESSGSFRNIWSHEQAEEYQGDSSESDEDWSHLTGLRDPPIFGSSHSGYRRNTEKQYGKRSSYSGDSWNSVQVAPRRMMDQEDNDDLQFALKLSLLEK